MAAALFLGLAAGAPDASAYISGDGKGKPEADCFVGLEGYDSGDQSPFGKKGKPAIQCTDCDPACDLDEVSSPNGSCVFSIAVRMNDGGVSSCTPAPLKKVKAKAKTKGTKINFGTTFQPPLDGSSATSAFVNFPVLVKKFGALFFAVAGKPHTIDARRSRNGQKRYKAKRAVRELLAAAPIALVM